MLRRQDFLNVILSEDAPAGPHGAHLAAAGCGCASDAKDLLFACTNSCG
jgi:hypothetical protein